MRSTSDPHSCPGVTRRSFLADTGMGFTGLALSSMLSRDTVAGAQDATSTVHEAPPHFTPKAKSVIWIFLCGGVSHVESFDVKPELTTHAGKSIADTPYEHVLDPDRVNKNLVGINPRHGGRKRVMGLNTG